MIQNTAEWLEWRRKHIGASDQAHLQMCAPWSKGWGWLYDNKKSLAEEEENEWMRRGSDLEQSARLIYSFQYGEEITPRLVESAEYPFLAASLDGFNTKSKRPVEIKCPNEKDHAEAISGVVPFKYWPQLCHQLYVTGSEAADYVSYNGKEIVVVEYRPDRNQVLEVIGTAVIFWDEYILKDIRPEKNYPIPFFDRSIPVIEDKNLLAIAWDNLSLREQIEFLESELDLSDKLILELCDLPKAKIGGIQIVSRAGKRFIKEIK